MILFAITLNLSPWQKLSHFSDGDVFIGKCMNLKFLMGSVFSIIMSLTPEHSIGAGIRGTAGL